MDFFVYLNRIEQRPNNVVMIGKNRNNHYCYNLDFRNLYQNYQNENYEMRNR